LYFNHIPRTGGTKVMDLLTKGGIQTQLKCYDRGTFPTFKEAQAADFLFGHYGDLTNLGLPDLKTATVIRNPIEQVVSVFANIYNLALTTKTDFTKLTTKDNFYTTLRTHADKDDPIKMFEHWLNLEYFLNVKSNAQSYALTSEINQPSINPKTESIIWNAPKEKKEFTKEDVIKKASELALVGTTENLANFLDNLFTLIYETFNIRLHNFDVKEVVNGNTLTSILLKNLNKDQKNKLEGLNTIDFALWEWAKTSY